MHVDVEAALGVAPTSCIIVYRCANPPHPSLIMVGVVLRCALTLGAREVEGTTNHYHFHPLLSRPSVLSPFFSLFPSRFPSVV
ncbi:hypothetical protein E2C01_066752 [Portunus trituberculatus]|uniref:Uncharacterized protein n=1 Tax=Portunus trituberculatus TaxID=210409 RepID=A0A5B7HRT9_PORTR|nr:hypothetical protein [Portunus trituberculatus]